MKIKHKLLGLTFLAVSALLVITGMTWLANERVMKIGGAVAKVGQLEVTLLNLRRNEKDFLMRMDMNYQDKFQTNFDRFQLQLTTLNTELDEVSIAIPSLETLPGAMHSYHKGMMALVQAYKQLGLKTSEGMHKAFFDSSEALILAASEQNFDILETYSLVQAAKMLLVTGDEQHLEAYQSVSRQHRVLLQQDFGPVFERFEQNVMQIARQQQLIGLSPKRGLRGDIRSQVHLVENVFGEVVQQLEAEAEAEHGSIMKMTLAAVLLVMGILVGVSWLISLSIQRRSHESEVAMAQQQAETDSVATAITEMGSTIREIASNTDSAAANADRSHNGAQEGLGEVIETKERIRSLSLELSKTSAEVASLSTLSGNIGSVLDVIRDIAEQTNLLALNAAIEAARAGEQGREFAVVADEVRSLAMRTRQSTEEITTIIASLQEQTDQVVNHIGRCREQGELSVSQADSAETKINQIMADMQLIMDTSTQIAAAVEQQSQVSDEIGQNVTSISDITQTNSAVAHENAQAANAVANQAASLDEAIAEYRV